MLDIQDFWSKETRHHQDIASQTFATMGKR